MIHGLVYTDRNSYRAPLEKLNPLTLDAGPAHALGNDLLSRWKSLGGNPGPSASQNTDATLSQHKFEDEKTIEELLADLGPSEAWDVGKTDQEQIDGFLAGAKSALKGKTTPENEAKNDDSGTDERDDSMTKLPSIDISVFQPGPELDEDESQDKPKADGKSENALDQEADDLLARLLDEVRNESPDSRDEETKTGAEETDAPPPYTAGPRSSAFNLQSTPSMEPDLPHPSTTSTEDEDLSARFASLFLPSVPTTLKSPPHPSKSSTSKSNLGFTDEEIDTWCIICNDNATLQCLGCDGDLFCTNCWLQGHRGESAGLEEQRHRAVQFVRKKGKRKVAIGA
jgi:hypothetical protein